MDKQPVVHPNSEILINNNNKNKIKTMRRLGGGGEGHMPITSECRAGKAAGWPQLQAFLERASGRHSRMVAAHGKRQGTGAEDRRFRAGTPACDAVTTDSHHCARGPEQRPALMSPVESEHWPCALLGWPVVTNVPLWWRMCGCGTVRGAREFLMFSAQLSCEPQTSENSVLKICNYASYLFLYLTLVIITKVGIFFYSKVFLQCHIITSGLYFLKEYLLVPLREQS